MAKGFNLTAQLNIQGPNNLKPVISKLKTALDSVNGNINIKISGTSTKTIKGLTTALQSLSKASIQTNANLLTLSQTIGSLGSGLASLGGASSGVAGLGKVRSSVSSTKKAVVEATSALSDFGKQSGLALKRFAAFTAVSTAAFTLGAAIKSGFQEFVVFDKEIVRLAQVTGKSTKELGGITKEITRLSTGLGVASADLLQVTTTLAQAGLTAGETRIALEALAKSALAPSFDSLKETTEGSIAAMRQFGIQAGELEAALGSVNAVAAAFAVESSDIITAIQRTGGVFASSSKGVSQGTDALNEFIAVFTSIRATTRESAETIATGLRTIFTRIQRGDTIEALKEYGIVLTDLKGKFVGPYEATRRLSEGLKSLDPRDLKFSKIVEELGGFRQIGKVIPLIKEFASAEAALEVAYKGQSSLAKDAAIAQQSLAVQFTKTRESFVALIRDIGDSASFKLFITLGLGLANAFITLAGALKPLLPMLLTLATIKIGSSIGEYSRSFMSGFAGKPKGKSGGGVIGFARGGFVPGTGSGDTIPAMLEPGEFVIRKKAVDTLGASNLHRMNKSGGGSVGRYAGGGPIKNYSGGSRLLSEVQLDKSRLDKSVGQEFTPKGTNLNRFNPGDKFRFNIVPQSIDVDKLNQALPSVKDYKKQTEPSNRGYKFQDVVAEYVGAKLSDQKYARLDGITMSGTPIEIKSYKDSITEKEIGTKIIASSILGSSDSEAGGILASKLTNTQLNSSINTIDLGNVRLYTDATKSSGAGGEFIKPRKKYLGGKIQKFGIGGKATAAEMYAAIKSSKLRVPNESMFGQFAGKELTDEIIRQVKRPPDASMSEEKREAYRNTGLFVQDAYDKDQAVIAAKLAERIQKSTKVALVGLLPFGHSKNTGPIDINGRDIMIYERGLDKQYEQAVLNMQAGSAGVANQFATDIQKAATIGGLKEYDFDDTLVTGAGVFDADGKIDVPGYKNIKRVEEALSRKTVALTPLGVDLKQQLESDPTALANIRIRTARPQSNAPALSKTLARLGLNIPATLITGLDGANKAVGLNPKATMVDDHAGNIEDVRKAGKKGIQYAPISALSQNTSMATGQANIEGAFIEQAMAMFGAPIIADAKATRAIDYPSGLGPAGSYFGLPPDWPAEVKRTIDSKSRATAIDEFTRYLFPKQVPVGKNLGGSIQKFAMGGASSDTVPAMLTPGEFVINKKAAKSIGYGKLNKMNHADSVEGFASGGPVGGVQYFADAGQVAAAAISTLPTAKQTYVNTVMGDGNKKLFEDQAQALLDMGHSAEEAGKKLLELASSTKEQKVLSNKAKKSWEDVGIKEDPELPIARQKNINIVAMAAASSILISKLQDLSATFAKSNSSIATGLGGLVTALEAGSSAVLSISVAKQIAIDNNPEIAKALKNPNSKASKALSFGTAAVVGVNAVGAGVSAVANKVLDTALAKNTKSLSDFDKSVQDLKDATDADAKSQARKKVQESFFALSKQINSSKDTIANAKSVKILADGAVTAGTALVTTATTLSMLLPLFKSLGSFFPALGAMGTGIALFVGGITAPVWGTIAAVVVGVGVALGALGYAFGFFEKSVVQVSPELTALAKAASAAAAANTALSLSSSEYNSQQLAAARIIKATAKNNGQSDESMRATFAQVELPEALKGNAQPNLANIYREEASGGFNINPVNVALIEHITDAIKTMNPNLDLAEKSLEDAIGMAGKTAKDAVKKGKDAYIESAYSKILNSDPSKNIDQLIGDRMFGGNTRQSTPENVALQNKLLALLKQRGMSTGNAGSVGRSLGYTPFTEEGKIKARKIVVESASNDANFIQVNGDLVKSGVKAVDVGLINLANTLKLFSSAIKKTTDDLASDISLVNEQTAMYFGEGKIEAQKYAKEISVLSNPSAATPDEIEGAYKAVRQNFSTGATPAVEEVMNRMESNTKALSSAEQQLPALIKAINRDYGEGRNDAMRRIADQMTATVATAGGLSPSSPQMREYNNGVSQALNITTDAMSEESLNTFSKAYGDATASMVKSTEVAKESLELLGKSGQLIADQQNSIVSKSLKNLELGFTKFNINNQFAIEKMRLFGESVSLDMLNAPIDNQLKTLTGGMTDPTSIAATYAQKSIEAQRAAETGADLLAVQALQTEADRFKQALDLLATNTDRAQNAMGKAAERLNELKSKRNLLESMLTGGAAKRSEMREFNNALVRLNKGDRGRLQTDIPLILKNIGMLGEKQQESIRARFAEMPEFSDPAVRGALNPKTDASLQESLAQAAKDVAVQTEAIALKIALNDTGIKTLTESIVDLTKAVNAENKRKTAQIEGKTAKTLTEITAPRTTTPQDQSSMKQNPISLIGDSGGLIKKFGADMEKEYKGWWTSLGTEDNDSMTRSRSMLSSKAFQNPEDGGVGLAVYDPTTEKGFAYLKLQIQTLQAAITANNSESGPISSMGPLMTKTLIDLIDRLTAATGARARGISDGQLRISTAPGPRFQPNQDAVDLTGGGAFSIPPEPVRSRTFPKTQTPPPIAPSPAMPINTTPLNNTTSNTTLYSPLVSALTSLVSVMKTYQETMAPTTDTTSPTTNSPLDGMVKVFDGAVLAFGNVVQDLAQVKIKTQSNVNLVTELVISGQTDLSPDSIDLIRQAYEKNTNEMIAKNTRNLETFG